MNIGEVAQESVALTWEEKLLRTEAHCKTKLLFKKYFLKWYLRNLPFWSIYAERYEKLRASIKTEIYEPTRDVFNIITNDIFMSQKVAINYYSFAFILYFCCFRF